MRVESALNFRVSESIFFRCASAAVDMPKSNKKTKNKYLCKLLFFDEGSQHMSMLFLGFSVLGKNAAYMTTDY